MKSNNHLALIFLACQIFGLLIVWHYQTHTLPFGIEPLQDEGALSLVKFVLMLAVITITILLIIRLKKAQLWTVLYFLGVSVATSISLNPFLKEYALIIGLVIAYIKIKEKDDYWHNITEILIYGGAVAVISSMFNSFTAIILIGLISLYDIYSVNYSKHMVKMAKAQTSTGVFPGLVINKGTKKESVLGGGDVAFPLLFASTFIAKPQTSILIVLFAFLGLLVMLKRSEKGKYYPAMPVLGVSSILGYLVSLILFT